MREFPAGREILQIHDQRRHFGVGQFRKGRHHGAGDPAANGTAEVIIRGEIAVGRGAELENTGAEIARFVPNIFRPGAISAPGAPVAGNALRLVDVTALQVVVHVDRIRRGGG